MDSSRLKADEIEYLCFEGGGVKGFSYIGVINELEKMGILNQIKGVSGTSIGSLFAAMLAIGCTSEQIQSLRYTVDIDHYKLDFCLCTAYSIWKKFGIFSLDHLEKEFRKILIKFINPDITLEQLYSQTQKELVIVAACVNRKKAVYFHHKAFPNVKLIDAILCSVSVPIGFQPRKYDFLGTPDYYVDGGLVDNFPIWVFNDMDALYKGNFDFVNKKAINPKMLGIKVLCENETHTPHIHKGRSEIKSVIKLGSVLANTLLLQIERAGISKEYIQQTIAISTPDIYFLDFQLTDERKNYLVEKGVDSVKKYFSAEERV